MLVYASSCFALVVLGCLRVYLICAPLMRRQRFSLVGVAR